ncbi:LysR substrate-binding domain-containing protein [Granulosicoccus antarcticus]|uniref:HTH-type transcriptional regulator DmlR n=1 Tax=Granulosicoccus antarcticus IMCC3135 TaxID=1192854 RepID=A0A2Z2NN25_9GAMM|nr:LysR substrate-binding domain-containing protein [Granulosicoccus antarcticus]ASJ71915.1 HTH-type transcriptional regulator DmlR [Granulosicoccus antarcticus IMCC3135]
MNTLRDQWPLAKDLHVFLTVIRKQSFAAAAEELGVSPAYISKRIRLLEEALNARLFHRTSRRCSLTGDGELVERGAVQILDDMDSLFDTLSTARQSPHGLLHICSSFGFGRNHVAPAVAMLAEQFPELEIRFDVFDRVVDIVGEGFDLEIRVGDDLPGQHISRHLVSNQRVLCAAPDYLKRRGTPTRLDQLAEHDCLVIKERNNAFGVWDLQGNGHAETVRINGPLSSNNGEIVLQWALHGRGILLRSMWDVGPLLKQKKLVRVLDDYSQSADVWAVYSTRVANSAKLRVCLEFFEQHFGRMDG